MGKYLIDNFAKEIMDGKIRGKGYMIKEGLIMRKN